MNIKEIKKTLKEKGMTQEALAKELGISYSALRKILCGASPLTTQLGRHIALFLGVKAEHPEEKNNTELLEIKRCMIERGWTMASLAKELEVTPEHLSRVLSGKVAFSGPLKKLLEYKFMPQKQECIAFFVSLPSGYVLHKMSEFDKLTRAEEEKVGEALIRHILRNFPGMNKFRFFQEE